MDDWDGLSDMWMMFKRWEMIANEALVMPLAERGVVWKQPNFFIQKYKYIYIYIYIYILKFDEPKVQFQMISSYIYKRERISKFKILSHPSILVFLKSCLC